MKVWRVSYTTLNANDHILVKAESHKEALRSAEATLNKWMSNRVGDLTFQAWRVHENKNFTIDKVRSVKETTEHSLECRVTY